MRKIKFRGWDKAKKIMYSAEEMGKDEVTINPDGRGFVNVSSDSVEKSNYYNHILPLQYTGLKDKQGVEVYEGDVVSFNCGACEHEHRAQIVWINELACWGMKNKAVITPLVVPNNAENLNDGVGIIKIAKVVGNIFEYSSKE